MNENFLFAFGLTLFAGLSTGIGSLVAFFMKKSNATFLSSSLGFSAGVMIYVSFVELFPEAVESLALGMSESSANWVAMLSFFGGMLIIATIDKLIPSFENPHTIHSERELTEFKEDVGLMPYYSEHEHEHDKLAKLYRMGLLSAISIAIHNFPEGIATFTAALKDPKLGIPIAVAVAIHNIPEGISVAVPIYYSTGSRKKSFLYSFGSGLAEPLGALVGFLILSRFLNDITFGILFGIVAGIMVFISLDELLPTSEEYGEHHISLYGLISGMAVMAVSLNMFV